MKFFTKEVKIALVAIVGLVVLFYGLNFLKGSQHFLIRKYILYKVQGCKRTVTVESYLCQRIPRGCG